MLSDFVRTDAYRQAVALVVRPGDVVIDFGSGTGVLSVFAARAGARSVIAVERSPIIHASEQICSRNGVTNVRFYPVDGRDLEIGEKADVIVSEWMGHFALHEWMLDPLIALRRKYLRPGGRTIPATVDLWAGFVTDEMLWQELSFFREPRYGIDFGFVADWPFHRTKLVNLESHQLADESVLLSRIELDRCERTPNILEADVLLRAPIEAFGLCGWFDATLAPGIELGTGPRNARTHWKQLFFPFSEPLRAQAGSTVSIRIWPVHPAVGGPTLWRWRIAVDSEVRIDANEMGEAAWLANARRLALPSR